MSLSFDSRPHPYDNPFAAPSQDQGTPRRPMTARQWLFSTDGRINRVSWWLSRMVVPAVFFVPMFLMMLVVEAAGKKINELPLPVVLGMLLGAACSIALAMWINIATSVKRLHDTGRSGWWFLVIFIPILGGGWLSIENGLLPGDPQENRFGPPSR